MFAARRLVHKAGQMTRDDEPSATILERARGSASPEVAATLDAAAAALGGEVTATAREALAVFLDTVRFMVEGPVAEQDAAE